jgi:hypothetical protein
MEVNGRLHALAFLILWKDGSLLMKKGAVWAPEPIGAIKKGNISLKNFGNRNPISRSSGW